MLSRSTTIPSFPRRLASGGYTGCTCFLKAGPLALPKVVSSGAVRLLPVVEPARGTGGGKAVSCWPVPLPLVPCFALCPAAVIVSGGASLRFAVCRLLFDGTAGAGEGNGGGADVTGGMGTLRLSAGKGGGGDAIPLPVCCGGGDTRWVITMLLAGSGEGGIRGGASVIAVTNTSPCSSSEASR